jgi:alpha-N-arabinofuranosidase
VVTTALLGKARTPDLHYEKPDGSPYRIDTDYFGKKRNTANPFPGPFELPEGGRQVLKVWPMVTLP